MSHSVLEAAQLIFREQLHNPALELRPDMKTGSLEGWDSFANVEILMACEERWGIRFGAADMDNMRTVGDLVSAIESKIG